MLKSEPAIIVSSVCVVLSLLVSFGLKLTDAQNTAIITLVTLLAPFLITMIGGLIIRENVFSKRSVEKVTGTSIKNAESILESKKG